MSKKALHIIQEDPWLEPYRDVIEMRHRYVMNKEKELLCSRALSLVDFSSGHHYFGLHRDKTGWLFREWAPNATAIYLIGTFNGWKKAEDYKLQKTLNGNWEIHLPEETLHHGDLYKLCIEWEGGCGERIPAWCQRVVQDKQTTVFSAQVWNPPTPYDFTKEVFKPHTNPLLIYECHIGMSSQDERIGTFEEFRTHVLPRIAQNGYNAIQMMGIQEHPYYGSFGYHVSSYFAVSSRFGTPEELKKLIDDAHQLGIAVIMDLVHSHAVKNEAEGLGLFDGTPFQYFHHGTRRKHPAWDSLCFDYGKNEVLHFLLSNCRFWLEEYHFDGFRFDGVTSMLYENHGLEANFTSYDNYYDGHQDNDAITYLTLANKLIHQLNPNAITIAEDMSGMPGLATTIENGGYGFDYRMAMNIPDFWIKTLKEKKDEDWYPSTIWWETTNRRYDEKTISYAESHDQALVGDKTIIFRLIDADMYWHMHVNDPHFNVERGIALHKMIRLVTATTINGGYLNFMGNEFGHPEWIDFPREGNGWSYKYARRQWHLVDDPNLKYRFLLQFDRAMLQLICSVTHFQSTPLQKIWDNDSDQILAYSRGDLVFVFNFNPVKSFSDFGLLTSPGKYMVVLNTDDKQFGGHGLNDDSIAHFTHPDPLYNAENKSWLKLYLPARSALVLKRINVGVTERRPNIYPFTFNPIYKEIIWGGSEILLFKGLPADSRKIGESWELSNYGHDLSVVADGELAGKTIEQLIEMYGSKLLGDIVLKKTGQLFPLLVKFIDACDDLSIQVHPNDQIAQIRHQACGKTEMWYVVKATPGAFIYSGFSHPIDKDEYVRRVEEGNITDVLRKFNVKAGDVFFLPAGRVHAAGSGCFIAEIQQTSDLTYRIYDYNRKDETGHVRQLHTELAKDAIDYTVYSDYQTTYQAVENAVTTLVQCPYFTTNLIKLNQPIQRDFSSRDSFVISICIKGKATLIDNKGHALDIRQGQTVLIPADTELLEIKPMESCEFLESYIC